MVDNQHKKITGYRDLSEGEIALMNEAKELDRVVSEFVDKLKVEANDGLINIDGRWLAIGRTDLEKGFMSIIRAIARPNKT